MELIENLPRYVGVILVVAAALLTTKFLSIWIPPPSDKSRYPTIDGLRGYLGLAVFICHASFWKLYAATGIWLPPHSFILPRFGTISVSLFFMITSFLFTSKLMRDKSKAFDCFEFFVSRFFRLTPLYLVAVSLMLVCVFSKTGWHFNSTFEEFAANILKWLLFTAPGKPDINGYHHTDLIVSAVTWTLPFEWFFYCSLPLAAFLLGKRTSPFYLLGCLAFMGYFASINVNFLAFAGGVFAALLSSHRGLLAWCKTRSASIAFLFLICLHIVVSTKVSEVVGLIPLSFAFIIIALGNTCFGMFDASLSRSLGDYTYGIYLLHGLALFVSFEFIAPAGFAESASEIRYWFIVACLTPILIITSALSFALLEKPLMRSAKRIGSGFRKAPVHAVQHSD